MATKITKATIERAKPRAKPYEKRGQLNLILRIQPTGKKTFYCQYGRGKRIWIGDAIIITLARAEYRAREILNEAHDFENPLKRDLQKSTLGGFIDAVYAPWVRANRRRADTTLGDLKRNFSRLYGKRLTDIRSGDLDVYVSQSIQRGRSAATMRRSLNNLQRVMRLAIENGYLRDSPFKGWEKPKVMDVGAPRYLDAQEERRLRKALADRDDTARRERVSANDWRRARGYELLPEFSEKEFCDHLSPMVLVSLNTGMRFGELAGLEWPAVDFQSRVLTVTGRTAKSMKTRHIPLNAEALDVLTRWRAQTNGKRLVFANPNGDPIKSVKTAWTKVLNAARITGFRWHDLRHSFASKLVQRGVDLPVLRALLGHSDFKLTLIYAHLDDGQKVDAVARLAA
jgi:site-specific recombinase XerD